MNKPHLRRLTHDPASFWKSAYVHIPFCARVCPYCDFAVVAGADGQADRYLAAVLKEIALTASIGPLDAVYLGGGTPSRFGVDRLAAVLDALRTHHNLRVDAEVSLEANPEDAEPAWAEAVAAIGFSRVSLGAQSFDTQVLTALGRRHSPDQIGDAVKFLREAGVSSMNLDLIFGTPGESLESWQRSLESAITLAPDHVSTYGLTVEKGTELFRAVMGGAPAPDPDDQADKWELAVSFLENVGMTRYEISNFARPGHECRYNLSVWAQGEYLAFGNGAHRHVNGVRSHNFRGLESYLSGIEKDEVFGGVDDRENGAWAKDVERVFLGLRRAAGVEAGWAGRALIISEGGRRLVDAGLIRVEEGRLLVNRPLLTDEVSRLLLSLSAVDC